MTNIVLNDSLKPIEHRALNEQAVIRFHKDVLGELDEVPGKAFKVIKTNLNPAVRLDKGLLGHMSYAYSGHHMFAIAPHDVWYVILTEIATLIKADPEACRSVFTKSQDKVNISISTDDITSIDLYQIIDELRELVPVDVDMFIPEVSTLDDQSRLACYAALCDGVQVFYNYMTFTCGIPEIKVLGTPEDWHLLLMHARAIRVAFNQAGAKTLEEYMGRIEAFLKDFGINTFLEEPNVDFWKDIFTQKNVGRGGDIEIRGWITKLFFKTCSVPKLENFPSTISVVPYTNLNTGREFKTIHGAFGVKVIEDGFLQCEYGNIVCEVVVEEVPTTNSPGKYDTTTHNILANRRDIETPKKTITSSDDVIFQVYNLMQRENEILTHRYTNKAHN